MKVVCIGTGSNGNGYVLQGGESKILLDAGCSWKEVEKACGFEVHNIDFALVTHEHG